MIILYICNLHLSDLADLLIMTILVCAYPFFHHHENKNQIKMGKTHAERQEVMLSPMQTNIPMLKRVVLKIFQGALTLTLIGEHITP